MRDPPSLLDGWGCCKRGGVWRKLLPIPVGASDGDGHDNGCLNPLGGVTVETSSVATTQRSLGENPIWCYRTSDDGTFDVVLPTGVTLKVSYLAYLLVML